MKKLFVLILLLLMTTGCMRIDNSNDYKLVAENIIKDKSSKVNIATMGYKYYLPKGVTVEKDLNFNQVFKANLSELYMYVDIVSYYYKNKLNNEDNKSLYNYYYEKLNTKNGYIAINKEKDDNYYIKVVVDYAKIEAYANKATLSSVIGYSILILNSIEYNDKLIEKYINDNKITSNDILYNIKKPNDSESKFNQYLQEYVDEEKQMNELPDE